MPGAVSFFIPGSGERARIGALCLHGLTASPQEVYWLGKHLAGLGLTVFGPRLAGHGTNFEDMRRTYWQDWYASALDGYHLLRRHCDKVFILGLSMGGQLTLLLGAELAGQGVAGLVVMASPVYFDRKDLQMAHTLRYVKHTIFTFDRATDPLNKRVMERQQANGDPVVGRVAYYRHSSVGISELLKLQEVVKPRLPQITAPTLLIYSEKDSAVPIGNTEVITHGLVSVPRVETVRLKESDHVLTLDVECDTVFERAGSFIQQVLE
jgi:carboxylesterase